MGRWGGREGRTGGRKCISMQARLNRKEAYFSPLASEELSTLEREGGGHLFILSKPARRMQRRRREGTTERKGPHNTHQSFGPPAGPESL